MIGQAMHQFATLLWPLNRSISGHGVRQTLAHIRSRLPSLQVHEVPSGEKVFDWIVPKEWFVRNAWIVTPEGDKICDFATNNLHLMGYSRAINKKMPLEELQQYLYSLPDQPSAVPYITSYYQERWGFCISQEQRDALANGEYEVFIDTDLFDGSLSYGELVIPGKTNQEVFLSTYICHPSMANNELSGPVVTTFIAEWLSTLTTNRYTYRIVFVPETIGSLIYLSKHLAHLKAKVNAGFNITCIGDDRTYSYMPSRNGCTLSDDIAKHVLSYVYPKYTSYTWADRGSDERQYCAPNIDLPIASIMRSKYGAYPEYHTSLDDLVNVVTPDGLEGGYEVIKKALQAVERNVYPSARVLGEPQLGKRGLYPTLSSKGGGQPELRLMMDLLTWSDGVHTLLEIAELCKVPMWRLYPIVEQLEAANLLSLSPIPKCK